jgi:hypothetical protein
MKFTKLKCAYCNRLVVKLGSVVRQCRKRGQVRFFCNLQCANTKHGQSVGVRQGRRRSPEITAYTRAKQRCINPNHHKWKDYGGRGIKFLFTSFDQFYKELGPRPQGKSLDRFPNNDGNYEPGNVRWATRSEQELNKRRF